MESNRVQTLYSIVLNFSEKNRFILILFIKSEGLKQELNAKIEYKVFARK